MQSRPDMLTARTEQVDLTATETHVITDLDQVVATIQTNLTVVQGDVLTNQQTVALTAQLDTDLLHALRTAFRQLQVVVRARCDGSCRPRYAAKVSAVAALSVPSVQ